MKYPVLRVCRPRCKSPSLSLCLSVCFSFSGCLSLFLSLSACLFLSLSPLRHGVVPGGTASYRARYVPIHRAASGCCTRRYLRRATREVCRHVPAHVTRAWPVRLPRGGAKEALPTRANACLAPFHPRLFPPLTHLLTLRDGNSDRDDVHKPCGGPAEIGISCGATRVYCNTYYSRVRARALVGAESIWPIDQVCACLPVYRAQADLRNERRRTAEVRGI